jgi:hypothetical protein
VFRLETKNPSNLNALKWTSKTLYAFGRIALCLFFYAGLEILTVAVMNVAIVCDTVPCSLAPSAKIQREGYWRAFTSEIIFIRLNSFEVGMKVVTILYFQIYYHIEINSNRLWARRQCYMHILSFHYNIQVAIVA